MSDTTLPRPPIGLAEAPRPHRPQLDVKRKRCGGDRGTFELTEAGWLVLGGRAGFALTPSSASLAGR